MDSTPITLNPETTSHTPEEQKQQQPKTAPIQQQRTRKQQDINPSKNSNSRYTQSRSNNRVQQDYEPMNQSFDYADDEETVPYQPESAKNPKDTDLESGLQLSMRLKQNVIQASSFAEQTFPMLVSLLVDDGNTASRAPIDLVCVIDVSGSMRGQKIQLVNSAFQYLLNYLDDSDRLSIVIFNSNAHRILPMLRMNEKNKHKVKSVIGQISAGGGTIINSGMVQAFEVLKQRRHVNPVTSIFLLSDGLDGRAQDQVKYSLSQYSTLDDVTIHTFGFGNDHDSQLMSDIADLRDGNFYFIKELSTIDQAFVDCLGGLLSSVAQSVEIKIQPEQSEALKGVEIVKALGEESMWKQENQVYTTKMLSLMSGKQKDFVLELKIPTCTKELTDNEKNVQVASAEVHIVDLKNKLIVRKTDLKITLLNEVEEVKEEDQEQADKDVMTNFFRLKSASLMSEARALAEQNKHEEAKKILMNFKEELENSFLKNEEVIKILIQDMEKAMTYVNPHVYQQSGKHGLKNNSRAYAQQKTNFDSNNRFQNRKQVDMMEQLQVLKNQ